MNFDKVLCELFAAELTLSHELSFALQFSKLNFDQVSILNKYEVPSEIEAIDARLHEGMNADQLGDIEYQFRVVYTLDAVTKSRAHFQFLQPKSAEGKEVRNVLVRHKLADELYPHRVKDVVREVRERSGVEFTQRHHTQAWRSTSVRPRRGAQQPENTNADYCVFHAAHGDYTYSDQWVEKLVGIVCDPVQFENLRAFRI